MLCQQSMRTGQVRWTLADDALILARWCTSTKILAKGRGDSYGGLKFESYCAKSSVSRFWLNLSYRQWRDHNRYRHFSTFLRQLCYLLLVLSWALPGVIVCCIHVVFVWGSMWTFENSFVCVAASVCRRETTLHIEKALWNSPVAYCGVLLLVSVTTISPFKREFSARPLGQHLPFCLHNPL